MSASMPELFEVPVQLSPRLRWKQCHGVKSGYHDSGGEFPPWCAWVGAYATGDKYTGEGDTEDDALVDLARKQGWRMWNEESELK